MKPYRMDQINELIQREISRILLNRVSDPRAKTVTVTGVRTAKDLKHARIYFSVLEEGTVTEAQECLEHAAGFIRHELGIRVRMKYTPELQFHYDESTVRGTRVLSLLQDLRESGEMGEENLAEDEAPGEKQDL